MNASMRRHSEGILHHHGSGNMRTRVGFFLIGLLVSMTVVTTLRAEPQRGAAVLESLPQVWRDDTDHSFNLYTLRGRPVVLTMAYATCHRICPMTMQRLQRVQESFDARGINAEFVIVGYDPENDDPSAWRRYRRNRHLTRPSWHFLVGSPQQVSRFARVLAFDFWKADDHVMHEQRIVYLDPNGALRSDPKPDEL